MILAPELLFIEATKQKTNYKVAFCRNKKQYEKSMPKDGKTYNNINNLGM